MPPQCRDQKASDCFIGRGCWPIPWLLLFLQLRSHKSQWGHFVDAKLKFGMARSVSSDTIHDLLPFILIKLTNKKNVNDPKN